jgi:hypothetical protein
MFDDMQNARKLHGKLTVRIFYLEYIKNAIPYLNKSSQP